MRKWFRDWIGSPESPPQAHILFVDAENSPPPPDLMMEAVLSHAGCELDLAFAWAKWYPTSLLLRGLREVGVECIQADEGSNNADIMLSLRAMKEVNKRAGLGQGGIAYVAFGTDKGFSHLLREIRTTKGWKSVYVTSFEDPPSILARSSSEVLYVRRPDRGKKKPVKSLPQKKSRRRRPKKEKNTELLSKKDELEKLLISLIGKDSLNSADLGKRVSSYQRSKGLQDTGTKALLKKYGLPSSSLNKIILQEFSEKISAEITAFRTSPTTGEKIPTSFEYSVKRTEEEPDPIPVTPFPQVDGFNNSSGLALPHEPSDTALVITQLPSAISSGLIKTKEIVVPIQEATGLPSTRIGKVIRYSLRDYFSTNQNDVVTLTTHPNQTQLFECLQRTIMEKTRRQQNPEDMAIIKEYFSRVEEILTAQSLEESTEFEDMILELIGKDQINSHTLSSRIIAYQEAHDWEETGKRAINQKFGFPLGRSYKMSIEKLLPERVEITGDVPRYEYRVKNELSPEEE